MSAKVKQQSCTHTYMFK